MKRLIGLALIGIVIGSSVIASAASITIPPASMVDLTVPVAAQALAPSACAGMGLTTIISGSGIITGTAGNDLIVGSAGNDVIAGLDGDDCLIGGGGNDALIGGAGNDVCLADSGNVTIDRTCER